MYKYDSCYYHSLVHIIVLSAALSPLGIKALILYYNITSQLKNAYTIHHKIYFIYAVLYTLMILSSFYLFKDSFISYIFILQLNRS